MNHYKNALKMTALGLALAAGQALAGKRAVAMMQNSGLGNAVSPLTSLNWVFRLPVLLIVTWRGAPEVADEPQHELMGQITTDMRGQTARRCPSSAISPPSTLTPRAKECASASLCHPPNLLATSRARLPLTPVH